ncbi:MAG: TonB-dependent receptor [Bacteroidia bacterium]|nr:MAG: TonB-dependent receptor [Bacteroidia bacterium]PIE86523.1 MAG: TonB-dependent receptor [Bacteroidia bacterium]
MKLKHIIIACYVLLFSNDFLFAQKIRVIDKSSMRAIENVFVINKSNTNTTLSDKKGIVDLSIFKPEDVLIFQHPGYIRASFRLDELSQKKVVKLTESVLNINEVLVSANKWEQNKREIPNLISVISAKAIRFSNPQTTADLLGKTHKIFIQKSQLGGGSPMIRGFSANRILIVIDGVRMNNAIYRSGNLQNVISIDPNGLENAEVIFGPGSVIYGSDALGGVMDFHTLDPKLCFEGKNLVKANALVRYSSANKEKTEHLDFNFGTKKWALASSVSFSNFGDLRMGSSKHEEYTRNEFVATVEGKDIVLKNSDKNIQKHTGYKQMNLMQKIKYRPNKNLSASYAFHYSKLSDVPRYDRLIQYKNNKLKYAEWYYGPQKWLMNQLQLVASKKNIAFDKMKMNFAIQNYEESRNDRKFGKSTLRSRTETVDIVSMNLDFEKNLSDNQFLFYGTEFVHNHIGSKGKKTNIFSHESKKEASRYPDDSAYDVFAFYANYKNNLNARWTINGGARFNHVRLNCSFKDNTFYDFPFEKVDFSTQAINGNVGVVFRAHEKSQINLNFATGFRAPNIDDIGKVFDSEPGNVVVPNKELESEYAYNVDFGIRRQLSEIAQIEVTGFYTLLKNAMVRRDFHFNGKDSILYDGAMSKVQALVNSDEATLWGVDFMFRINFSENFSLKTNFVYAKGEDKEGLPLRHVPPHFGNMTLLYKANKLKISLAFDYNGEIAFENLAASEQDKTHIYASDKNGNPYCPAWQTLNTKVDYSFNKYLYVNTGIENILDTRYRPYSSGIVAPGRNFSFTVGLRY